MLSLQLIREHPDLVQAALAKRDDDSSIDQVLALDLRRRQILTDAEALRARRNEVSKQLAKQKEKPPQVIAEMREVGSRIKDLEEGLKPIDTRLNQLLLQLPNLPVDDVPIGEDDSGNLVVRTWGEPRKLEFDLLPHWEIGERLGILDFDRGVKISGSRFYVLKGKGARLQRALIDWMVQLHVEQHGYQEVYLPYMVKEEVLIGSGNLPKFGDNLYHDAEDDLWLIPTAEVPITGLHRDEILPSGALPLSYVAYSACFRREKMSAGRDTRGIKRGHQFDKVEMYKLVEPETSDDELSQLVSHAEAVAQALDLPYRLLQLCTGDLGFQSAKSFDIEIWAPGVQEWLEVSSCSNCTDFQARRSNIRYRPEDGGRPRFVHTLNGSGLALPRVMIAILENYQQPDGSVLVPEVLHPYTRFDTIEPAEL